MANDNTLLVTMALPYANGDIHLGHLVEAVQTDIFVRYHKLTGRDTVYICADDTHGTPIQLNAQRRGITPESLIATVWQNHVADYAKFGIGFDRFYTTNSPENRKWAEHIYQKLRDADLVVEREIEQYYCEHCSRFLPDRFIMGTCPKCSTEKQYGDGCESCGTTYDPTDLIAPSCSICGNPPAMRKSSHFFVQLAKEEAFLREYLSSGILQDEMKNFVMHWIEEGLHEWCISRDEPYFGFRIPGTENKFFYVWLDAPIGYISSTDKWCSEHRRDVADIWSEGADAEVVHFIGKDIVYFHTLFWPVMLKSAALKQPSRIFVHGFLTVGGEKMSKSRGTFILAREYAQRMKHPQACEYLRFYYGCKLSQNTSDLDLSADEFCTKVNTLLCNNIGNLHNRTFVFIDRFFEGRIPDADWDATIAAAVELAGREIAALYEEVEYRAVVEKIQALGTLGNQYYQSMKPWELVKTDMIQAAKVMTTCANLVKALGVFLKPFVPHIAVELERQFGLGAFSWDDHLFSLKGHKLSATAILAKPILPEEFEPLFADIAREEIPATPASAPVAKKAEPRTETADSDNVITFDDFTKISLRVGLVEKAERVEKSDKLLRLQINDGTRLRQIIAGIGKSYEPEALVGRRITFVANLKPAKLMGNLSEGMILAAKDGENLSLIMPDTDVATGSSVG